MKLKTSKLVCVRDHIGNTYEVVALAADDTYGYGIKLCCETLIKPALVRAELQNGKLLGYMPAED